MDYKEAFIELLRGAVCGEMKIVPEFCNVKWEKILYLAQITGTLTLLCEQVKNVNESYAIPEDIYNKFVYTTIHLALKEEKKIMYLEKILLEARNQGIEVIVFKGPVVADAYSDYRLRVSSDTDMYVDDINKEKMIHILEKLGYTWLRESSKLKVQNFTILNEHYVELHTALWEDYSGTKIDTLQSMNLTTCENRINDIFCGIDITTLKYEKHLIFLLFHFAKHMIIETANIRFIVDILLFFVKHQEEMNIKELQNDLEKIGYWDFFNIICNIGVMCLGMDADLFPFIINLDQKSIKYVLSTLIDQSIKYKKEKEKWQMVHYMMPYFTGDNEKGKKDGKRKIQYLFPNREQLPEKYSYAKKHVILLPLAWGLRMLNYIFERLDTRKYRMSGLKRMNKIDDKLEILRKFKLV